MYLSSCNIYIQRRPEIKYVFLVFILEDLRVNAYNRNQQDALFLNFILI